MEIGGRKWAKRVDFYAKLFLHIEPVLSICGILVNVNKSPSLQGKVGLMPEQVPTSIRRTRRWRRPAALIGNGIGGR